MDECAVWRFFLSREDFARLTLGVGAKFAGRLDNLSRDSAAGTGVQRLGISVWQSHSWAKPLSICHQSDPIDKNRLLGHT